jgi:hypothetical protein
MMPRKKEVAAHVDQLGCYQLAERGAVEAELTADDEEGCKGEGRHGRL